MSHKKDKKEMPKKEMPLEETLSVEDQIQAEVVENVEDTLTYELGKMTDTYLRLQAEFDNYRKRTLKEKIELSKNAGENIFISMLPVVDDLERAMQSIEAANDLESLKTGMELIYAKFCDFTKQNGVQEIKAVGENFDLDQHEAITKIPAPSEDLKGKIVDCVQKGYTLNGKVIRFSKVVIGE